MARPFSGALWLLFALVLFIPDEHGVLDTYGSAATFSSAGTGGTNGGTNIGTSLGWHGMGWLKRAF